MSFQVRPKKQEGTSGAAYSLAEGCRMGERDVSDAGTDISSSARTGGLGGTMSGPRRGAAAGCCGQNVLPLLGSLCLVGPNQ